MAAPKRQESVHRFHIGGTALRANSGFPEVEVDRELHSEMSIRPVHRDLCA